jgi:steroid delta-isomerase-like uncharacterized protein
MAAWWEPYIDAWNAHDGAGVAAHMAEDGVYTDVALGESHTGRADIRDWINGMATQFSSDYRFVTTSFQQSGSAYAAEWTMTGTHDGPAGPLPPTGKAFTILGVSIGTLDSGGRIARNTDYWDMASFLGQVGMLPAPEAAAP